MSKTSSFAISENPKVPEKSNESPRSLAVAVAGIRTGTDFANLMSALMSDIIDGRITPAVGNAACNAGGKLLKVVEMQYRYGTQGPGQEKVLRLTSPRPDLIEESQEAK